MSRIPIVIKRFLWNIIHDTGEAETRGCYIPPSVQNPYDDDTNPHIMDQEYAKKVIADRKATE